MPSAGIALGGAFHPNARHLAFAIGKLEFVKDGRGCLCALYERDHFYNPVDEEKNGRIRILDTTFVSGPYVDFYDCECVTCGARYRVIEREPMRVNYRGATITTAALPSAGGIALTQAFGMLEHVKLAGVSDAESAHTIAEVLRRVFRDRIVLGDTDHVKVPVTALTEKAYIKQLVNGISATRATASDSLSVPVPEKAESYNTTHFSVIDGAGNRVGATITVNWIFGSGLVAKGTGVLLNNEMDDFTLRADVPNSYRLRGSEANAIAPGKRPLSSMTPTFVEDERGVLILGAPGGSRIISMVLLGVLEHLRTPEVDLQRLVAMPRYHHQFWPDRIEVEPEGFGTPWRAALQSKGHVIQQGTRKWGNMQAVFKSRKTGIAEAASDPRGSDVAWY